MSSKQISIPEDQLAEFGRKWGIRELSIFGSVLRPDFDDASDVDVLISFLPGHALTFEGYVDMCEELSALFAGREIDLVEKRLLRNPFRRREILTTRKVVYATDPP